MTQGKALAQYGAVTVSVDDGDDDGATPLAAAEKATPVSGEATALVPDAGGNGESWIKAHDVELAENDDGMPRYRDVPFAVLFYLQLAAMIYVGVAFGTWGEPATTSDGGGKHKEEDDADFSAETHLSRIVYYLVLPSVGISFILAYLSTAAILPRFPITAVKASVVSSLITTGIFCLLVIISAPGIWTIVIMGAMFALMAWYVKKVWRLIPFAAANLKTALVGMSSNWGTYVVALAFAAASGVWAVFWMYAANGVFTKEEAEDEMEAQAAAKNADDDFASTGGKVHWGPLFLLLVSLYWTTMVLLNMIQTTVAGVMGTWCFAKEDASTCCSPAVTSSLYRTCTYSFGSICLGSLMDAVIKALRVMAEMAKNQSRENSDDACAGVLFCILECILRLLEDIIEYFNQWAYVFVGIYGYGYVEAGRKVMELFRARGWTAILTDDLVGYVLNVTSLLVSVVTGLIAVGIQAGSPSGYLFGDDMENGGGAGWAAFFVGFFIGLLVSSVMMNVIKGAVNTVVVCFADAPAKLEENHPQLTYDMAVSWVSVFPDCGVRVPPKQPVEATVVV